MTKKHLALFIVVLQVLLAQGDAVEEADEQDYSKLEETAENVCIEQRMENKTVNVTYMQTMDFVEYTWCLQIPPRCPNYKQKIVEAIKQENVTRLVNVRKCCPGYKVSDSGKTCEPVCDEPCENGFCYEPNVCSCHPGFTGPTCETFGCPEGNWGPGCSKKCPCINGGSCEPTSGRCQCLPGWTGLHCQSKCDALHYGSDCKKECSCKEMGEKCYHVTGDCLPCPVGTFGSHCSQTCSCNSNGTALCYHVDGSCFCKSNWYGPKCDLHCPFGYVNGVCYVKPMSNETACSCPGEMYVCDPVLGCVCDEDKGCDGGQQIFSLAPLQSPGGPQGTNQSSVIAIIVTLLIVALVVVGLGFWYYRRRTKVLQKDLQNRSVYYVENSILDPARHHQHDLVVQNPDHVVMDDAPEVSTGATSVVQNNLLGRPRHEKNVNIDAFKLGTDDTGACERSTPLNSCGRSTPSGACGSVFDESDETFFKKPCNVNMLEEIESPLSNKNNAYLEHNRKVNKPKLNSILNRAFNDEDESKDKDEDSEEDEIALAKMSNYLKGFSNEDQK